MPVRADPDAVQSVDPVIARHAGAVSREQAWAQDADGRDIRLISRQAGETASGAWQQLEVPGPTSRSMSEQASRPVPDPR